APKRSLSSLLTLSLLAGCLVIAATPLTALAAGNVTGTVFRDYDGDGVDGATEPGVGGVTVTAYNAAGTAVATATTSSAAGTYTLTLASVATGTPLRIEFTTIPTGLKSGPVATNSETTVRFVTATAAAIANVNLAVGNPAEYTPTAPTLVTPCYLYGH